MLTVAPGRTATHGADIGAGPVRRKHWRRAMYCLIALAFAGGVGWIVVSYQRDIQQARQRVAVGSQVAETACGPIEYAAVGDGPTVLVVHGAGGGFDQALDFSHFALQSGFRV